MSLKPYPTYKDSGVAWLGKVPTAWALVPFWALFKRQKNTGYENEQLLSVYRDYGVIPKASRDDNFNNASEDLSTYKLVEPGDLAINKMKAWQGSVGVSRDRGIVSPAYFVYKSLHSENSTFLHYLLRSPEYTAGYMALSKGIRVNQWDLDPQYHSRMPVLLPSTDEQTAIADFLDRETAKIDDLIAEQEKLIALLAEKRQATISHAVTKGLNPEVPMKDSGVEWLGEIPAHWEATKSGRYLKILSGFAFPSTGFTAQDTDTRLLRGINVGVAGVRWDETVYWARAEEDGLDLFELAEGDVVLGMDRPWIEAGIRIAKLKRDDVPSLLLQRVVSLKPNEARLVLDYIKALISSDWFFHHCAPELTGVSVPHLSPQQIQDFVIPLPPTIEQVEIAQFIDEENIKLDSLTAEANRLIYLLKERRTALISAAVTGKIDVRDVMSDSEAA